MFACHSPIGQLCSGCKSDDSACEAAITDCSATKGSGLESFSQELVPLAQWQLDRALLHHTH